MGVQCELIGHTPDTRSIGSETGPQIRSANGELLNISSMAQAEVNMLFDSQEKSKPRFNSGKFKGSLDPSHFIFEINVGKRRIRHRTTLDLNESSSIVFDFTSNSISESL